MRKILIVIDMQKDFIDGSLGSAEAVSIVENVKNKIEGYDPADVIFTRDTHHSDYLQTQEGINLPVKHCIEGTEGWQIRPELAAAAPGALVFDKPTFGSMELAEHIRNLPGDIEVELVGLCTDICVVSNAMLLKAARPEMKISVDASCCAGVTPERHAAALTTMAACQIKVV
ncbi:MAG: cysteine hydrolase [Lachnospiraceae bacterium]|nr:cysteine hydrolase [Lachnospiraceae bacterium]